ncbi:MAG: hypothetical protein DHS20C14_15040 [Phycisphaeraceae bacterium]|nr:MAG: hypothetical protein DHS20C14_15040 [Phycisphaeraceae bacterium]
MHFCLVDRVLERTDDSIVTIKLVSGAEEYLQDHFPTFPVLPGVFMLEAMVQAARELLDPDGSAELPIVLGRVRALKYGTFVKPGDTLRSTVTIESREEDGVVELRGEARVISPVAGPGVEPLIACTGRLTMRPARITIRVPAGLTAVE